MNLTYTFAKNLFSTEKIKELNKKINENFVKDKESPASDTKKTSKVKFIKLAPIQKLVSPFLGFIHKANTSFFDFDLFKLTPEKILNYNIYEIDKEYGWHYDGESGLGKRDIKLTCLLNCSEEKYVGGELSLFVNKEIECKEFNSSGSAIVFPSFINHKVNKILSGKRRTLAIWMHCPRFR